MPSLRTVPRRRRRSEEDKDDYPASSPASLSQTSNASKRARLDPQVKIEGSSHYDDDDDDDGSTEGSGQDTDSGGGSDEDGASQEEPSTQQEPSMQISMTGAQSTQANGTQSESEAGGYKPGSIVRIKVNDFVTYTSAEFFPGPKLNMVIGPNGTGKSTLVCAICLGLGWGPQVRRYSLCDCVGVTNK